MQMYLQIGSAAHVICMMQIPIILEDEFSIMMHHMMN